ncbi:hypothetical protein TNCV_104511 [Trichonephila clavipes]|nr:hypothetical protein TNCV_104511 [Trichonephila clavipes]
MCGYRKRWLVGCFPTTPSLACNLIHVGLSFGEGQVTKAGLSVLNRLQMRSLSRHMPFLRFRGLYEQLFKFQRERIIGMMEAGWSARRVACQLGQYDGVVGTSGSERCHLHEDQAQDALDKPVVEKKSLRKKCTRTANCFINRYQSQVAP